jgi:hypothetical protein
LTDFLKEKCKFKENVFADVYSKLDEHGIETVDELFDLSVENL